jgi:dihydrofolate reductase
MKISLVAALDEKRAIGRGGRLPWRLPDDQRFFRELTMGHCLVMGRRTFESIGRALPGRTCFVLTHRPGWEGKGALPVASFEAALEAARARGESELFVVGGAEVYAEALPRADSLYLTRVHADAGGDVFFPELDPARFRLVRRTPHPADARHAHAFSFEEYARSGL